MTKEQFDKEKAFYTAQISLFERERNVAGLQSIVQKVVNQQLPPTPGIINRLVTSLHRLSCSSDIYALFRHLTHVGSPMPIIVCNAFLAHYTSMRDATKVQLVMSIMRSTKLEPDLYTFNSLLKYAIGKGDNNEVQQVLRDMARHDISPDVVSYNQILTPLAKSGNFEECQKVLDQMKQRGVEPDVATYTILIEAHARAGDWTKCDSLIGEMTKNDVEKDVRIYNAMMTQASFKRDWRRCDQIWNQIRKEGLTSKVTYNVRMRVCLMRDKMEEVTQIMNEMKENDIPLDSDSYLSLIRGAADLGRPEVCQKFFNNMVNIGLRLTTPIYYFVIKTWLKKGDINEALAVFNQMKMKDQHLVDSSIFEILIQELWYSKSPELNKVIHSIPIKDIRPNSITGAILLSYYGKNNNLFHETFTFLKDHKLLTPDVLEKAKSFLTPSQVKLITKSLSEVPVQATVVKPSPEGFVKYEDSTMKPYMDLLQEQTDAEEVKKIVKEMIKTTVPFHHTVFSIIHRFMISKGMWNDLCGIFDAILAAKLGSNRSNFGSMINTAFEAKDYDKCLFYFAEMKRRRLEPFDYNILQAFMINAKVNNLDACYPLYQDLVSKKCCTPNVITQMLRMVCQKGDPKEVSQIFRNMHNLQISPTQSGYYQYLRDHDFVFPKLDSQAIAQFINDVVIHEQNAFVSLAKPYIAKLARIANVEEAVQVLLDMEKSNIPLHSRAFQHFFAVTCRLSSIYKKEAYFTLASIFDRFRERNLVTHEPATIYSMMVTRACELLDFERAESYYSEMVRLKLQPNIKALSDVFFARAKLFKFAACVPVYKELALQQLTPLICDVMIRHACETYDVALLQTVMTDMRRLQIRPLSQLYNQYYTAVSEDFSNIDSFVSNVKKLHENQPRKSDLPVIYFLDMFEKHNQDLVKFQELIGEMQVHGFIPSESTSSIYHSFLRLVALQGDYYEAQKVFDSFPNYLRTQPIYEIMEQARKAKLEKVYAEFEIRCVATDLEGCKGLVEELKSLQVSPSHATSTFFSRYLALLVTKEAHWLDAVQLFEAFPSDLKTIENYRTMFSAATRFGDSQRRPDYEEGSLPKAKFIQRQYEKISELAKNNDLEGCLGKLTKIQDTKLLVDKDIMEMYAMTLKIALGSVEWPRVVEIFLGFPTAVRVNMGILAKMIAGALLYQDKYLFETYLAEYDKLMANLKRVTDKHRNYLSTALINSTPIASFALYSKLKSFASLTTDFCNQMALHFCGIEDLEHLKVVLRDMNDLSFTLSTRSLFILNQFLPATGIELPPELLTAHKQMQVKDAFKMETTHRKMRRETKEAKAIQPTGTKTIQSKNGASYIAKIKEAIESNSPWEQEMKEMILAYERNTRKVQSLLLELFEILDSSGKLGQGIALYKEMKARKITNSGMAAKLMEELKDNNDLEVRLQLLDDWNDVTLADYETLLTLATKAGDAEICRKATLQMRNNSKLQHVASIVSHNQEFKLDYSHITNDINLIFSTQITLSPSPSFPPFSSPPVDFASTYSSSSDSSSLLPIPMPPRIVLAEYEPPSRITARYLFDRLILSERNESEN